MTSGLREEGEWYVLPPRAKSKAAFIEQFDGIAIFKWCHGLPMRRIERKMQLDGQTTSEGRIAYVCWKCKQRKNHKA